MHHYWLTKEQIRDKSPSEINILLEMIWYEKNPEWLKKYKTLKFDSEFDFDQYIMKKMKFI